ncbi:MAG: DNA polymerase III subunit alpha, partial [Bacillaceae bacterium]|nr:DNA polymerase III subunit alpha [Bacillaceae bacterium]
MVNTKKTNQSIVDAKRKGIKVLPPCINKSENHYTVENPNEIRLSLSAIKNVGLRAVDEIVHEREKDGNYKDFLDFCVRIDSRIVNRRAVESLILAGCFEGFNEHRSALLASLDEIVDYAEKVKASQESDQTYLFINEIKKPSLIEVPPFREDEILKIEKEIFGFYFSGHPIEAITTKLVKYKRTFISNVRSSSKVRVAGYVESVR